MYGPLLLIIICLPILIATIVFGKIAYNKYKKYESQCYYYDSRPFHQEMEDFYNADWQLKLLHEIGQEEKIPALQKAYAKQRFWHKLWIHELCRDIIIGICGVAVVVGLLIGIISPVVARYDVAYWEEFVPMAQEIIDGSDEYEKVAIADDIIEYNTWLVDAKTSQKFWGNWSSYYGIDLSELPTLAIGGQ